VLTRPLIRPISITLGVVGGILMLLAIVYVSVRAGSLPSFMPGHLGKVRLKNGHLRATHAHVKLGLALFVAAVAALGAGWFVAFRYEPAD